MLDRPVRIVHCEGSQSFLLLTRDWLEDHHDLEIVHSALGADEALSAVRALHPDVVVTDTFGLPSDPAILTALREAAPGARLVIFTGYRESHLHPAVRQFADAVVTKSHHELSLVETIRALLADQEPGSNRQ